MGGIANPLLLQHWDALWESTGGRHTRLYDMFNVEYVLAEDGVTLSEGKFEPALDAPGPLAVYRNLTALPRAWVVYAAVSAPDLPAALEAIRQPDFDPEQSVVLTAPGDEPPALPAELVASAAAPGGDAATVTAYGGNRLAFDVEAAAPGVLVISEVWYPGWRAAVNGKAADVWAANGGLRAVAVPAGSSTVELVFRPLPWRIGIGAALVGLIGLAALLWIEGGRPERGADSSTNISFATAATSILPGWAYPQIGTRRFLLADQSVSIKVGLYYTVAPNWRRPRSLDL